MNELMPINPGSLISSKGAPSGVLSQLNSNTLLSLCGMACATIILCVGCVCFSGSEMAVSKDGLSVKQPNAAP